MKFRQFLSVVPKSVKTLATVIASCALLIGLIVGADSGTSGGRLSGAGFGLLTGIAVGVFLAAWVVCLGYVYADARRRNMPPILWTLVAMFVPNLLGFLIYFAIRQPIARRCAQCGQPITANHRFCSWCGFGGPVTSGAQIQPPASANMGSTVAP